MTELTIQQIARDLASRWLAVTVVIIACVASATVWALMLPPIFRAEVLLMPVSAQQGNASGGLGGQLGGLAALAGLSLGTSEDRKVEAVATLQSRLLTEAFVQDKQLLPILFSKKWDSVNQHWKPADPDEIPTLWDANKLIDQKIRYITTDKKSGLITLSIDWTDPVLAADWANELIVRTNSLLRARAIQSGERNIQYLEKQLVSTSVVEVRQALYNLVETELKTIMLAQSSQEYAFRVIDPAVVPQEKFRPKRALIVVGAFLVGVFLSVLLVLLLGPAKKDSPRGR